MKHVILAGGKGKRMRPLTETIPKPLLPCKNKPLIEHVMDATHPFIDEYVISVGYLGEKIRKHFKGEYRGKKVKIVEDQYMNGPTKAILAAEKEIEKKFLVTAADIITTPSSIKKLVSKPGMAVLGAEKIEQKDYYGKILTDDHGKFKEILEKKGTEEGLVNTGIYKLTPDIFQDITYINISDVDRGLFDVMKKTSLAKTTEWQSIEYPWHLLEAQENTFIHPDAQVHENTLIRGNCYIGPDVVLGKFAEVKNSYIMHGTKAKHTCVLSDSLIGPRCSIGGSTMTANVRFDNKEVEYKGRETGRRKFGAVMAEGVKTGANSSTMPGTPVEDKVYPNDSRG